MNLVLAAKEFASWAHRNQTRNYTQDPYIIHCEEVVQNLNLDGLPVTPEDEAIAWLHDVIEDCEVPPRLLDSLFGEEITRGVLLLTKFSGNSRQETLEVYHKKLALAPKPIQRIKLADVLNNVSTIKDRDPKFALRYLQEKKELLEMMDPSSSIYLFNVVKQFI